MTAAPFPLTLRGIDLRPEGSSRTLATDINLNVGAGELVCLKGRSGTGKTTLLRVAAGLLPPAAGAVLWSGQDISAWSLNTLQEHRALHVGWVDQGATMIAELNVLENITVPRGNLSRHELKERAQTLAAEVGIEHTLRQAPHTVSGGERQRAAAVRALVTRPRLMVLDEPTASLDEESAQLVLAALSRARDQGAAILVAAHDPLMVAVADRTVEMNGLSD
ncbi:MAG: ATP-binding cassette domain-containing protein [Micrococcus sp.]|nr:ATP-binding cassette domain-containing protein [Micrococcus sp.]